MLRDFPRVRHWEETDDVLQNTLLRLVRALEAVPPGSVREFFGLAAQQIRRELLDQARHYYGPRGAGRQTAKEQPAENQPASTYEPNRLAAWGEFHEQVEVLPEEERAVFDLLWYQGLTQAEAARVLDVSLKTVKRRWLAARLRLKEAMRGEPPEC